MSLTAKMAAAAAAGSAARFAIDGHYSPRKFFEALFGGVGGFFVAVMVIEYVPLFDDAPEMVRYGIVYLCALLLPRILAIMLDRMIGADISVKIGVVNLDSKGAENGAE